MVNKTPEKKISGVCLNCSSNFFYKKSASIGKYCSNKCQAEYQWRCKKEIIRSGEFFGIASSRRFLVEEYGEKCVECGLGENWNNKPIAMHVDHIDGNSDNNVVSNLRLLCPNCHSQTETFGSRNIKNSNRSIYARQWRKKFKE